MNILNFFKAFARKTDPETSKQAGSSVDATNLERIVLDAIKRFPEGCILEEIELAIPHIRASSISPRIRPLINKGYVVDTHTTRPGSSGRNQRIVKAVI